MKCLKKSPQISPGHCACDVKVDIKVIKVADGKLMGIAVDLSPNYYNYLEPYRRLHPSSRFGLPGRLPPKRLSSPTECPKKMF